MRFSRVESPGSTFVVDVCHNLFAGGSCFVQIRSWAVSGALGAAGEAPGLIPLHDLPWQHWVLSKGT